MAKAKKKKTNEETEETTVDDVTELGQQEPSAAEQPASVSVPVAAAPVVQVAQKRLRRIYKVDTSKWVEGRRPR